MVAIAPLTARADEYTGEKTLGLRVGYNTYNTRPLAGVQFSYRFNRLLRLAPDALYVFRNDGRDALLVDVNMQFLIPYANSRGAIFPLAGLNYSSWNWHGTLVDASGINDVSTRTSRLGLNAGAGIDINVSGTLKLSVSGVYTFIKHSHGANITAGIHYRF